MWEFLIKFPHFFINLTIRIKTFNNMKTDRILLIIVIICCALLSIMSAYYGQAFIGLMFLICAAIAAKAIEN